MCDEWLSDGGIRMALLSSQELRAAEALARIGYCNPFLPERLALERTARGTAFRGSDQVLHLPPDADRKTPDAARQAIFLNFAALRKRAESLTEKMRSRLLDGAMASERELGIYRDMWDRDENRRQFQHLLHRQ